MVIEISLFRKNDTTKSNKTLESCQLSSERNVKKAGNLPELATLFQKRKIPVILYMDFTQ